MSARGRPRAFDAEVALDQITVSFWRRGYQATSIEDLERGTSLSRTSLYGAFGDKQAMFARALDHYWNRRMARTRSVLEEAPTARAAIAALLRKVVANLSDPDAPPGCLRVNSAGDAACLAAEVKLRLRSMQDELQQAVVDRLRRGKSDEARALEDDRALAGFVVVTINGLAAAARIGVPRSELERSAAVALSAIPEAEDHA